MSKKKQKGFFSAFKKFIFEGNAFDLAVGVIIGAAMKDLVNSLVADIFGPVIGNLIGKVDFSDLSIQLGDNINIKYGAFLTQLINFIIIAFVVFLIIRLFTKIRESKFLNIDAQEEQPSVKICPFCKSEININATKCSHCTADLNEAENEQN